MYKDKNKKKTHIKGKKKYACISYTTQKGLSYCSGPAG